MSNILAFVRKQKRIYLSAIKQNRSQRKDPYYFQPDGIQVFYGEQGTGKTIAMINMLHKLRERYPNAIIASNVKLHDIKEIQFHEDPDSLLQALNNPDFDTRHSYIFYSTRLEYQMVLHMIDNGKFGVIIVTDEFQNYFSNQDSNSVPPWVIEQAAQNRKQRRVILATSQDYNQIVKAIRRRSDIAFECKTIALPFTSGPILTIYYSFRSEKLNFNNDGVRLPMKPLKVGYFFHSVDLRESYDTHQVIFSGTQANNVFVDSKELIEKRKRVRIPKKNIKPG